MDFLVVDDEELALEDLSQMIKKARPECRLHCFTNPVEALAFAGEHDVQVAFLDIEMAAIDGIATAKRLKEIRTGIHIIFATSYDQYALDAFSVHATGYLLKPVALEDIQRELNFVCQDKKDYKRIQVKTFGGFDVFVDGKPLSFKRSKSKEFLACLVDRQGNSVTLREIANLLFEDGQYDMNRGKYMQTIYAELHSSLKRANVLDMLVKSHNSYAVNPEAFDCDSYRFLKGDPVAINSYRSDYMICYSWAEFSLGEFDSYLEERKNGNMKGGRM